MRCGWVSTSEVILLGCDCRVAREAVWQPVRSPPQSTTNKKRFMPFIRRPPAWRALARPLFAALISSAALLAAGCHSLPVTHFADATPRLDPMAYFTGHTQSWGVFETRAGDPARRFRTDCHGRREGDTLVLDQTFTYDDGHQQLRHWRIRRVDAHRFAATANDVVGTGTGEAYGNTFRWEYTVALKPGHPLENVRLRQWMYLQEDGRTLLNRGSVRALGIEVAQVTEQFRHD